MEYLDANIFLRYFTKDDKKKAEACLRLFEEVERRERIVATTAITISEVVYVMTSKNLYDFSRSEAKNYLISLLSLPGVRFSEKKICIRALQIFETDSRLDFEDAYLVASLEINKTKEIYSYDRDFDRIPWIERREP